MLAWLVLAQIGGYFQLGPVPNSLHEGQSFKTSVTLETTARKDTTIGLSGEGLTFDPPELVILKGEKTATFRVTADYLPDERARPVPLVRRMIVSSGKSRQARDFTVLPRNY